MLHAIAFALMDSINALLIGVVVALGVILPRGKYKKVAPLLILGDWCGVFALAAVTMVVLDKLKHYVDAFMETPILGLVLIVFGLAAAAMTWLQRDGQSSALTSRLLTPLRSASWLTFATGFVLGAAQSITSGPFFAGLIYLSQVDLSLWLRYVALFLYAALALSLPAMVAIFVGLVRSYPESWAGSLFARAQENKEKVSQVGSYAIAIILVIMGISML
ncbi:MAG: hypothetical protein ACTH98_02190 [Corynebacterium flavescens]|uniref:hypothetical protein n=1 Tax=Corynebacterium flavescens TaxID=28028 RepID=UPI00257B86A9|nr:hypothetical protein [Corynebacterium sp. UBA5992]